MGRAGEPLLRLTMASPFIAEAVGDPLTIGEQLSLLAFMIIASKGAAGVTGAGQATLAGGLSAHRPVLAGDRPFDEATMLDDDGHGGGSSDDAETEVREAAERPVRRRASHPAGGIPGLSQGTGLGSAAGDGAE